MNSSFQRDIESTDGDSRRDEILDEFEQLWLNAADVPDVVEFCKSYVASTCHLPDEEKPSLPSLALSLALVDLEFRWRRNSSSLKIAAAPLPGDKSITRGTAWYFRQLKPFGLDKSCMHVIALNELEVRSRWGDQPTIQDLAAEQLPEGNQQDLHAQKEKLLEELQLRFPISCNVYTKTAHRFRTNLQTPCIVGRQRSTDPKCGEIHFCSRENGLRFVVAERGENSVSRKQLSIERLSVNRLSVTSLSPTVSSYFEKAELPLGKTINILLPASGAILRFGGFSLHLQKT